MASFDPMAASQIDVDPAVGDGRYEALVKQLIARGLSPAEARKQARAMLESPDIVGQRPIAVEEAELNAMQDAAQPQINSYRAGYTQPAPGTAAWAAQERSMGMETLPFQQADEQGVRDEFYRRFGREPSSYREIEMMREMMAEQSASQLRTDLAQGGYGQRRVPGPAGLGRWPTAPMGKPFSSVEEAAAYNSRPRTEGGFWSNSQKDRDMRERGYEAVIGPDGKATYMVAYDSGPQGAAGRAGPRPELTEPGMRADMPNDPKYVKQERTAVDGRKVQVLVPSDAFRKKMAEQDKAIDGARANRKATHDARMERFLAQVQLGGGRQTPQSIQLETVLNGMTPEQRQQAMRYMAPGGQLAAGVDAQNMQNANEIIKRFMTSGAAGLLPNPAVQAQVQQQQVVHRAGRENDLGELYAPSGMFGYNEFAPDEQESMYNDLIAEGYTDAEARAAVNRQAQKRRATTKKYGAAPAPSASPPAVVPPGSVPPV